MLGDVLVVDVDGWWGIVDGPAEGWSEFGGSEFEFGPESPSSGSSSSGWSMKES